MPAKNIIKDYQEDSYYHIYNRGVAKGNIFIDSKDYKVFLSYLKLYLTPVDLQGPSLQVHPIAPSKQVNNYSETINLLAYCLMPNHFHLLVFQKDKQSIKEFMRSLGTKYVMYFNRKHKRVGPLFQSRYKAVKVDTEDQLVYLTKYIHKNPAKILPTGSVPAGKPQLVGYKYSSYPNYLGLFNQSWVKPDKILHLFDQNNNLDTHSNLSYQSFVEELDDDINPFADKLIDS